jgi:type II secretory pathway component PulM
VKQWLQRLTGFLSNLAPRERVLVGSAGAVLALALVFLAVIQPIRGAAQRAADRVVAAQHQLEVMQRLRRDFDEVSLRLSAVEQRIQSGPKGNLRTTLETLAQQAGVKIESMEPQASPSNDQYRETKVDVVLKEVSLAQTVGYLHAIESTEQVLSVKGLRIRIRSDRPDLLDVNFNVSSFEPL